MTSRRSGLEPPAGLVADVLELGDDTFAILEWSTATREPHIPLGAAEREVLRLLLAGLSNAEIARHRQRSVRTIAKQVASVFARLGVKSRLELFSQLRHD